MRWLFRVLAVVLLFAGGAGAHADFYDSARDPLTQQNRIRHAFRRRAGDGLSQARLSLDALAERRAVAGGLQPGDRRGAEDGGCLRAARRTLSGYRKDRPGHRRCLQAITLAPTSNAQPYFLRAEIWSRKGDYGKAVADYDAGLGRDPKVWAGRMQRGLALAKLGDDARALPALDEAIKTDPHTLRTEHHKECVRTQAQTTPNCKTVDRPISTDEFDAARLPQSRRDLAQPRRV